MSKYYIQNKKGESFSYGYDNPLQEYFMDDTVGESFVGTLSEVYGSAGNLMEAAANKGVWELMPESHKQRIAMDLPF